MAFITADRVKDTSTTTGTGSITVSGASPTGYRTFSTVLSAADTFYYCIQSQTTAEWEVGIGTYSSANVFARTTILSSSNSNLVVPFQAGVKNVFITLSAKKTLQLGPADAPTAGSIPYGNGSTLAYTAAGTSGQVLTSAGAGTPTWATVPGTGTVTSVAVSGGTTGLTTSGGPITASGTVTLAGTLAVANGGTGVTSSTGTGSTVLNTNPTLTSIATGTPTSRTLADRFADTLSLKDFGAIGDGSTDDTVAVNAWIAEVLLTGNVGYAPAGNYKVTSPILIDYVSVASYGFTLIGAGVQRTKFTSTVTTGAAFALYCSGGVPPPAAGQVSGVYAKITALAFSANTVGPTLRIGKYDYSDQQNLVRLEIWCSNASNSASARCIEMNSCFGCHIEYNGNIGHTNPPPTPPAVLPPPPYYTESAAGINLSLRKCAFSQFFISIGSTAGAGGATIGTATGVWISEDFNFGNVFIAPDFEILDVDVVITSPNALRNTFIGGQWAYKSFGVVATAGNNNIITNPNTAPNPIAPFFQSGANAIGVSRVDATSLFNYQIESPASGGTITVGNVLSAPRFLRLTHSATIAILTIALPANPFDGQVLDIFTSNAVTSLTLTPTPFDTITTLPANSGASFFYGASSNLWFRIG
jgi:hypothetical protein